MIRFNIISKMADKTKLSFTFSILYKQNEPPYLSFYETGEIPLPFTENLKTKALFY